MIRITTASRFGQNSEQFPNFVTMIQPSSKVHEFAAQFSRKPSFFSKSTSFFALGKQRPVGSKLLVASSLSEKSHLLSANTCYFSSF